MLVLGHDLLDTLLPPRCAGCAWRGAPVCGACALLLRPAPNAPPPPGVSWWTALFEYEGVARELVARAKYRNERAALRWVGPRVAAALRNSPLSFDAVTFAPASHARCVANGVDHGSLLARAIAHELGTQAHAVLQRARDDPQTGRTAHERRSGPRLHATDQVEGLVVAVVDDVATTGGTLAAAARALRAAGAVDVVAATIARTPHR